MNETVRATRPPEREGARLDVLGDDCWARQSGQKSNIAVAEEGPPIREGAETWCPRVLWAQPATRPPEMETAALEGGGRWKSDRCLEPPKGIKNHAFYTAK